MECGAVWVRVSLGAYFSDERARCMMAVPGEGGAVRRAGWLARRLRRTFGLPRRPALLCQGHLLPPAEPLPTRAPLLLLEAVPPSGRVVDVSRHRASDDDSDAQAGRVRARAERPRACSQAAEPAPDGNALPQADENDEVDGGSLSILEEADENHEADGGSLGVLPVAEENDEADISSPSLDEMKRRALALLEGRAGGRRRRRVRRRRAAPASPPAPPAPAVLRNEEGSRRAPRHVRALSPPGTEPPPPDPRAPTPDGHDFSTL